MKTLRQRLPNIVKTTLSISDGWLVGSAAEQLLFHSEKPPRDYDIIVPFNNWQKTILSLRTFPHALNSFGGMKFKSDFNSSETVEIDLWPQELSNFLNNAHKFTYIYNINSGILLKNGL